MVGGAADCLEGVPVIKHCVFCKFKDDLSSAERLRLVSAFDVLLGQVNGMISFEAGVNLDFEAKSPAFTHGFIVEFENEDPCSAMLLTRFISNWATHWSQTAKAVLMGY